MGLAANAEAHPGQHRGFARHVTAGNAADDGFGGLTLPAAGLIAPLSLATLGLPGGSFGSSIFADNALNQGSTAGYVLGSLTSDTFAAGALAGRGPHTDQYSDEALGGETARHRYHVTGAGVKIGVLSDSFGLLGGMYMDERDGNLPRGVRILQEGPAGGRDEGRAMADIIHSIAPGAQILFHTATDGEANFAAGIAALKAAGCTVIVDDVAYLDEPFFQDGSAVQAAVENAIAGGASYFTAASNEGTDFIQQSFQGMRVIFPGLPAGTVVQNFGSASAPRPWTDVSVPTGGVLTLDMQWNQPFAGIGGASGSANSIGMALYDPHGHLVAAATQNRVGGNPDQVLSFTNTSGGTDFRLVVFANGGSTLPGLFKIINYGDGALTDATGSGSGTVIGQEIVPGANTVGAVDWSNTTAFGGNNAPEAFSSVGTGDILYGANGQALAQPLSPGKVNFLAPDGSLTSVMAPFFGTSAAAPAAAAVAALMMQADPLLTPTQVTQILEQTAAPAAGPADAVGAGLIQASAAVGMAMAMFHTHG